MECDHVSKIVKFGYKLIDGDVKSVVDIWGCTKCDATSTEPLYDIEASHKEVKVRDHSNCDKDPCFGCKIATLQVNTGDANSRRTMTKKAFDNEMNAYSDAVRQGVEPASTNMKDIQAAMNLSQLAGKAFDSTDNSFKD